MMAFKAADPRIDIHQIRGRDIIGHKRNGEFTVRVKQRMSDGAVGVDIEGFVTGECMIALIAVAIQDFMNDSGSTFEEVVPLIEATLEHTQARYAISAERRTN
jgi:hypothetical protein